LYGKRPPQEKREKDMMEWFCKKRPGRVEGVDGAHDEEEDDLVTQLSVL